MKNLPFGYWWHWSNDTQGDQHESLDGTVPRRLPLNARAWLHRHTKNGGSRGVAEIGWSLTYRHFGIKVGVDDESGFVVSFGFGFYVHLSYCPSWLRVRRTREIALSFHDGGFFWSVWRDPMGGWDRSVPKWREGAWYPANFFLGRVNYTTREVEKREVSVPMPEKAYPATATLFESTWKRPRWFPERLMRVTIDVPGGIPKEGKGENSWDCGEDATFGITCPARSIPEGIGHLVGSVLKDRVKYGGWQDWHWERPRKESARA